MFSAPVFVERPSSSKFQLFAKKKCFVSLFESTFVFDNLFLNLVDALGTEEFIKSKQIDYNANIFSKLHIFRTRTRGVSGFFEISGIRTN